MKIRQLFQVNCDSSVTSVGLLLLRALVGLGLLIKDLLVTGSPFMLRHFPESSNMAAHDSLAYALLADCICTLLLLLGLFTRPVALVSLIDLLIKFVTVHHAAFLSEGHAEFIFLYIGGLFTLLTTGPGRYNAESWITPRHFGVTPKEWENEQFIEAEFPGLPWQSWNIMPF
jgi:putative oxidoreductase